MQVTFDPTNSVEVAYVARIIASDPAASAAVAVAESPAPKRRRTRKKEAAVDPAQSDIEDAAQAAGTVSEPAPEVEQGEPAPEPAPTVGGVTVEQVRTAFTAYVQRTNTGEALKLLKKFGVKRVSGLAKEQYADFIKAMNE